MSMRRTFLVVLLAAGATAAVAQQPATTWSGGITPGDVLLLRIFREPDLELSQTVPANGIITFPRVGPFDVRGMATDSLRARLVRDYAKILTEADARVQLEVHRKVTITGAVRNAGVYTLHPTMSVGDALATAGGPLPEGRTDRIELRRNAEVLQILVLGDATALANSPVQSGDQLHVPERSFASRNLNVLVTAVSSLVALAIALAVR